VLFCHKDEATQHLFFECRPVRMVWAAIHVTFGLQQPRSAPGMFGHWLTGICNEFKPLVLLGLQQHVGLCG
jgi:hypothetical protein